MKGAIVKIVVFIDSSIKNQVWDFRRLHKQVYSSRFS